jgi:outer membrane lipoprotein-sorting protein
MSVTRAWDRAGLVPASVAGVGHPEVASLGDELPTVPQLFTFMRDAELRFTSLRMRIEERAANTRGEDLAVFDVMLRHPGNAKILTSRSGEGLTSGYEVWISDGETVREYVASRKVGTKRPVRRPVRGTDGRDLPGRARVYKAVTPLAMESLPELFIHPGGYCQNVLGTGSCRVTGTTEVAGREAIVLECDHPRTIEIAADRPDFSIRIAVDRLDGVILRLEESVAGQVTRDAVVTAYQPNAPLPPNAFEFSFPSDTTFIY